jgi:uncharacterized protein (UPF0248 family)
VIPIEDLLHRLQWDPAFGHGAVRIGYHDHIGNRIVRLPFDRVRLTRGHHFSFEVAEDDGTLRQVPFHRIRKVWRDGEPIWERRVLPDATSA